MSTKTFWRPYRESYIQEFADSRQPHDILVHSEICDDDIIPSEILFRKEIDLPEIELEAIGRCQGKILDVGAGAGAHARMNS